jgi:amidase
VADSALLLDLTADRRPQHPFADAAATPPGPLRIAVSFRGTVPTRIHPEVRRGLEETAELLRSLGHEVTEAQPRYPEMLQLIIPRYLAGVADDAARLDDPSKLEGRSRRMARAGRLLHGRALGRGLRREAAVAAKINEPFERVDVLITPTVAHSPQRVGRWNRAGAIRTFNGGSPFVCYTAQWNYTGQPAAAVPAGFDDDGLPLSVQLVARPDDERTLLSLAAQIERARPWEQSRPRAASPRAETTA